MTEKKFTLYTLKRNARPRSKRLRELGSGGGTSGGSTVVINNSNSSTSVKFAERAARADFAQRAAELTPEGAAKFLSATENDTANGHITFANGTTSRKMSVFTEGLKTLDFEKGTKGAATYKEGNDWHHETDYLHVRKKITAKEVVIEETTHAGGIQVLSAANARLVKVEETENAYRCYFRAVDGEGRKISNKWKAGDQAFTNTFNLEKQADGSTGNHYYWRLVTAVGTEGDLHWLDLSKTDADEGSDTPKAGDSIIQLGNRNGEEGRTAAIYIAGAGTDSPYIRQFVGITSYQIDDIDTQIKPGDNRFKGRVEITEGSGAANLADLPEEISKAVQVGGENLLLNTGFDGDYESIEMSAEMRMGESTEMYSPMMQHWDGDGVSIEAAQSRSGHACQMGSISQAVRLIPNERYVLSWKANKGTMEAAIGNKGKLAVKAIPVGYSYCYGFTAAEDNTTIALSDAAATIWELKLERGTIATDWCPSTQDNDPTADKFKNLWYLQQALHDGGTNILGGLILSSIINLGKYVDGKMAKATAGMSGIYNEDNDVAIWGGGTFEQAIQTVAMYSKNPQYQPSEAELQNIAKVVFTHGGRGILNDVILRGYVYAKGGIFRGTLEATDGYFSGVLMKKKTVISSANIDQYLKDNGDGKKSIDILKVGTFITFENLNVSNLTIVLPRFVEQRIPGDYQAEYDKARQLVGNTFSIYNYSDSNIVFEGNFVSGGNRPMHSIGLLKNKMCSLEARLIVNEVDKGPDLPKERIEDFAFTTITADIKY